MITAILMITFTFLCMGMISYQINDLRNSIKNLYYKDMYQISYLRCLYINQLKLIESKLILEERFEEVQNVQELIQIEIDKQKEDINNFKTNG